MVLGLRALRYVGQHFIYCASFELGVSCHYSTLGNSLLTSAVDKQRGMRSHMHCK